MFGFVFALRSFFVGLQTVSKESADSTLRTAALYPVEYSVDRDVIVFYHINNNFLPIYRAVFPGNTVVGLNLLLTESWDMLL